MKTSYAVIALVMSMVVNSAASEVLSAIPPNIVSTTKNKPMVMLTASKDVTMFWKAYTDFEDIDFDGKVDYTFKPDFKYYGYFDYNKCYTYGDVASGGRFVPAAKSTVVAGKYYCTANSGQWSGNFLNWATMSRMDILRKVLYGGFRSFNGDDQTARYNSGDSADDTTLELSFVPRNSQAFAKYYNGSDLDRVTPFNSADAMAQGVTLCRRPAENAGISHTGVFTPEIRVAIGNYILWNMTEVRSCNWVDSAGVTVDGVATYSWQPETVGYLTKNYVTPEGHTAEGVTAAGVAEAAKPLYAHKGSTPVKTAGLYVGGPNLPTFTARVQVCVALPDDENNVPSDGNCVKYGNVYKPTGLLQKFGESKDSGKEPARAEFALMMGSYRNNLESGVLRKNMGEINDEINPITGQFILNRDLDKGGIIRSFNEITLYGYDLASGQYSTVDCPAARRQSDKVLNEDCASWGNPVGELLLEATRYYSGHNLLPTKSRVVGDKDDQVGLPYVANWVDPITADPLIGNKKRSELYGRGICRPLNMITVSGGANSFDNTMTGFSDLTIVPAVDTPASLTKNIGVLEKITADTPRLVGNNGAGDQNLQCTKKTITDLAIVEGVCPDGPNFRGTYLGAGVAHYANTKRIRSDFNAAGSVPSDLPHDALTVRNYGVTMSGGVATIEVPLPGQLECSVDNRGLANPACKRVYITPASLDSNRGAPGPLPGNMVDFKVLRRSDDGLSGTALVLWQHSMLGEDQDQDMLNSIRWSVNTAVAPPTITIYTQAIESNTGSAAPFGFGYTLVGTDKDGLHMHSGINKFLVVDPTGVSVLTDPIPANKIPIYNGPDDGTKCVASNTVNEPKKLCSKLGNAGNVVRGETYKTFVMTGETDAALKEPLWYIAKYGGFTYTKADQLAITAVDPLTGGKDVFAPAQNNQWDRLTLEGHECGNSGNEPCDGIPDNYFYARRPDLLQESLDRILETIVGSSNTAPAISASQLQAGDLKVVAAFDGEDGSGTLTAYKLSATTGLFDEEAWKPQAHTQLTETAAADRQVITNRTTEAAAANNIGIPFEWGSLNDTEKSALSSMVQKVGESDPDFNARKLAKLPYNERMLGWLRGSTDNKAEFRTRPATSIMGPIVNSNPTIQTRPQGRYFGDEFSGYADFVSTWKKRRLVLWAGAGDGMLHAFDASSDANLGGKPIMSYIPQPLFSKLQNWAAPAGAKVQAMVDGSPFVGDVKVDADWHTYLFSSLGRGGKAIFALDVTKAGTITTVINDNGTPANKADDTTTNTLDANSSQLNETHAGDIFKWQLTSADAIAADPLGKDDLGYIVSEPTTSIFTNQPGQIARMNNHRFAAIFGNGVDSTSGRAALFIVFADGKTNLNGGKFKKIVVPIEGGNGLSTPTWVDVDNDRIADFIYAGDLLGNLWRFDVSDADSANWKVSYFEKPLFTAKDAAGNALPITGAPEFSFTRMGGVIVSVTTGKSLRSGDFPNTSRTHGMFGIWDNPAFKLIATPVNMEAALPRELNQLAKRVLINAPDDKNRSLAEPDLDGNKVPDDPLDWTKHRGWYFLFNVDSEMGLNNMNTVSGQFVTVTVSPPPAKAGDATDACSDTPVARLIAVDPITGLPGGLLGSYTDPDTNITYSLASIGSDDQKLKFGNTSVSRKDVDCKGGNIDCTAGIGATEHKELNSSIGKGRIFWREIPGLKTN